MIEINVSGNVIVSRVNGHRVRLASGRTYHVTYNPPRVEDKDGVTGEDLIQRDNDKEEVVKKHPAAYHEQAEVLVDFYNKLESEHASEYIKVDGTQPVEAVKIGILSTLDE